MADNTIENTASLGIDLFVTEDSLSKVREKISKVIREGISDRNNSLTGTTSSELENQLKGLNNAVNNFNGNVQNTIKSLNSMPDSIAQQAAAIKKYNDEIARQHQNNTSVPQGSTKPETISNYTRALAQLESQATVVFHNLRTLDSSDKRSKAELTAKLQDLTRKYKDLNHESVEFRKTVGISGSRGFYDLNSTMDYMQAKLRSKMAMMAAEWMRDMAFRVPQEVVNDLSKLQQAQVNFAQVMPDSFSKNQTAVNNAMKEFIQIAANYGASLDDVTEAARLWGRQYKDIGVIQELVNNSTKLSITDNMSLTEVNKALEATMSQYNIQLKDANQAQEVSGKIVDSWAKLADMARVKASDMALANEQSAGAAHQAGISFDYLQGMIATMSGVTGKSGAEIGRSIRSMIVSMNTSAGRKELERLGISLQTLDKDGKAHVRNFEEVLNELMQKIKTSDTDMSQTILKMSGGRHYLPSLIGI